jgi:murein DD-endopeptidase MepM/ murein hydrolase activator NlpD
MLNDIIGDTRRRILATFPERQIYLRSGGEVSYFNLSTRLQLAALSVVSLMALWCVFSIINMIFNINPMHSSSAAVKEVEARYARLLADSEAKQASQQALLAEQRKSFEVMAANLEAKHQTISHIVSSDVLPTAATQKTVQYADAAIVMAPTIRDTNERVARRTQIDSVDIATGLPIDNSLTSLDDTQNAILLTAEGELLDQIERNRALIEKTEMSITDVLAQGSGGTGGPFIPLDGPDANVIPGEFQPRVNEIQARFVERESLDSAVRSLPLGHPIVDETYMSSDFGVRSDPFTKRPTFHGGIDFGGRPMAPIQATAPGTVIFAGRNGAMGIMVEIDHGHGFTTRYGHLKKTFVKRGQSVEKGTKIGGMGSTGRSTATHLHYEVRFDGRAYDPENFLKAGKHVQ